MLLLKRGCSNFHRIVNVSASKKPGDKLGVQGWIQNIRRLKNNIFYDISDGSTTQRFQVVVPKTEKTRAISAGSSIKVSGCLQVAPNGNYELHAQDVNVIADGQMTQGFPFTPKQKHAPEYVREHLHLRARVDSVAAQLRLRHKAQKALHDYMDAAGFVHINTPIITTNDCEGAGEVFTVQPDSAQLLAQMERPGLAPAQCYFGEKVFLSVSGQLHLEAMSYGLGNTYTLSPAFRAENSKSPLHLAEFYMFEAELAFVQELAQLTQFIEQLLKTVTTTILETCDENVALCQRHATGETFTHEWLQTQWPTLSYDEALGILQTNANKFKSPIKPAEGFSKEQEFFLVAHCKAPVFVVDWPADQKPFYMKATHADASRVAALDLLMPAVGELCGGSLRETNAQKLRQHPQFPLDWEWYLQLRQFGGLPTGGFGMGFERYLQLLTGVKNIRDVIPFPRYPHSCKM